MQLLIARTLTIGFILGFTHLVTIPAPVLCSHDCGEIHVLGATEHIGHDLSHETEHGHGHGHAHDHDAEHEAGHGCEHSDGEDPHDDASCVDVSIMVDSVLPPSNSNASSALSFVAVLVDEIPSIWTAPVVARALEDDPASPLPPLPRLGRLLI